MRRDKNALVTFMCFALIGLVYVVGLFLDLLDVDSAQYGLIAREMYQNHHYLEVYCRGTDYLDKPPMLFWSAVMSFKIFGINHFAFRLPSLLVSILGLYSLYRFTRLYYEKRTAVSAALIAAACQAFFLMQNDVRTDTLLTGFMIFAIWQIAEFNLKGKFINIMLGAAGIGCAMLSKGPIGLIAPVIAFSADFIYKRDWKNFLRWQYLPALVLIAIILLPMSYGLYQQFDLHPEKNAYSIDGPSGLRFFFWTQSFGRITGESSWANNPDPFFLFHSFLWSFLPWSLLFIPALVTNIHIRIKKFRNAARETEIITTAGFVLVLIMMSRSAYQLPHYTFMIHPLAAVITADYLTRNLSKGLTLTNKILMLVTLLSLTAVGCYMLYSFPGSVLVILLFGLMIAASLFLLFRKLVPSFNPAILSGVIAICAANLLLNVHVNPALFQYQSDSRIAKYLNAQKADHFSSYKHYCWYSTDFYFNGTISADTTLGAFDSSLVGGMNWAVSDSAGLDTLRNFYNISSVREFYDFPVSTLTPEFLNPATRKSTLSKVYVFNIQR